MSRWIKYLKILKGLWLCRHRFTDVLIWEQKYTAKCTDKSFFCGMYTVKYIGILEIPGKSIIGGFCGPDFFQILWSFPIWETWTLLPAPTFLQRNIWWSFFQNFLQSRSIWKVTPAATSTFFVQLWCVEKCREMI